MWIARWKWDDMVARVQKLEDKQTLEPMFRDNRIENMYYGYLPGYFPVSYEVEMPMADAIRAILKHLGVKIAKREGKTEYVVEKVKKEK